MNTKRSQRTRLFVVISLATGILIVVVAMILEGLGFTTNAQNQTFASYFVSSVLLFFGATLLIEKEFEIKSRGRTEVVSRAQNPFRYWTMTICLSILGAALMTASIFR